MDFTTNTLTTAENFQCDSLSSKQLPGRSTIPNISTLMAQTVAEGIKDVDIDQHFRSNAVSSTTLYDAAAQATTNNNATVISFEE